VPARIVALIAAAVVALASLGLLGVGGVLLWADGQKDDAGYLTTDPHRFATSSHALATDNLDLDLGGSDWVVNRSSYGKLRVTAEPRDGKAVFVGIARTADVSRYLSRTGHDLVTDVELSPFRADYRRLPGSQAPPKPGLQDFWAAESQGTGPRTLTWDVEDGAWSIVVMNADGTRDVDVSVEAGAELAFLDGAGWGVLAAGLVMLSFAAALTVIGVRTGRRSAALV
jgi:hypothetical protein